MRTAGSSPAGKAVRFSRLARVLPGVLALLVVTGCAGTGHASPAARAITSCGPDRVPGYSNHRSYPPGIPTLPPPGAHIIGCFASPDRPLAWDARRVIQSAPTGPATIATVRDLNQVLVCSRPARLPRSA
jgi:hypothetical protein